MSSAWSRGASEATSQCAPGARQLRSIRLPDFRRESRSMRDARTELHKGGVLYCIADINRGVGRTLTVTQVGLWLEVDVDLRKAGGWGQFLGNSLKGKRCAANLLGKGANFALQRVKNCGDIHPIDEVGTCPLACREHPALVEVAGSESFDWVSQNHYSGPVRVAQEFADCLMRAMQQGSRDCRMQ